MRQDSENSHSQMAAIVERNINALAQRRKEEDARKTMEEMIADRVTNFAGSMLFVSTSYYLVPGLYGM